MTSFNFIALLFTSSKISTAVDVWQIVYISQPLKPLLS